MNTQTETTTALFPLWDSQVPFPSAETMEDLDIVTHVSLERAQEGGFHYLHEPSIALHQGALYACWANHRIREVNTKDEIIRGRRSTDGGITWEPATTFVEPPMSDFESFNHPVIHADGTRLWGFFTSWQQERPCTAIFTLDDASGKWVDTGGRIPEFVTFRPPMRLPDGNWIISGEHFWYEAAVAISRGDDFTSWESIQIPRNGLDLQFAETTLMVQGDQLLAIMRPHHLKTAPVSFSKDNGRTWTPMELSNFPLGNSQPYCGMLSTGHQYLITNNQQEDRTLLSIAVAKPGETTFSRIWKIRHQKYPLRRLFGGYGSGTMVGQPTEWSYPSAIEHDGKLYICYTQGKEDCALSIIPLSALTV